LRACFAFLEGISNHGYICPNRCALIGGGLCLRGSDWLWCFRGGLRHCILICVVAARDAARYGSEQDEYSNDWQATKFFLSQSPLKLKSRASRPSKLKFCLASQQRRGALFLGTVELLQLADMGAPVDNSEHVLQILRIVNPWKLNSVTCVNQASHPPQSTCLSSGGRAALTATL
jgi:hypothetical protein